MAVEDQVLAQAVRTFLQDVRFDSALVVDCRCFVDAFSFLWRHELYRVHDSVVAVSIADGATYRSFRSQVTGAVGDTLETENAPLVSHRVVAS